MIRQQNRKESRSRAPTLADVASQVGMSVSTVGRALGGYGRVSATTRDRIHRAARELGYHPNALARGMKARTTKTIGLIVGNIMNPFFGHITRAVEDTVSRYGFNVIVCNTDEDPEREIVHARALHERRVDGLIVSTTAFGDSEVSQAVKDFYQRLIPTVFVDRTLEDVDAPAVVSDNVDGAYLATKHFLELGHRNIGLVVGKRALSSMQGRIDGYRRALVEFGALVDDDCVVDAAEHANVGVEGGYAATQSLLERSDLTAILVANNLLVIGALRAIKERNLEIPTDLSVIAWDDFELSEHLTPPLTVVNQSTFAMGTLAAERLIGLLAGIGDRERLHVLLKPELVVRESTSQARSL